MMDLLIDLYHIFRSSIKIILLLGISSIIMLIIDIYFENHVWLSMAINIVIAACTFYIFFANCTWFLNIK